MRIVSLLPSATEIICQLGLAEKLVGVSHECEFPPGVRDLPRVTRSFLSADASSREIDSLVRERFKTERALYSLDMPTLERLRPDLIVTQALCDVCAVADAEVRAAACALPGTPRVINLEPACLDDVFDCLRLVGESAHCESRAEDEIARLRARVAGVDARTRTIATRPRVVLLEWIDPPFSSGHWSPELVRLAGGEDALGAAGERSRTVDWQQVVAAAPEVLTIACCGFSVERTLADLPILRNYPGWSDLPCVRSGRVYLVDGSAYFNRPGPRLVDSLEILAQALHPDIHPLPSTLQPAVKV